MFFRITEHLAGDRDDGATGFAWRYVEGRMRSTECRVIKRCRRCGGKGYYYAELPDSGDTAGTYVKCACRAR